MHFRVHYSVTIRTKNIILGGHLLLHHVISVIDPHLALTYITWYRDFALYPWLYLIDKHHIRILVQFHTASDLIFVSHYNLYFMIQ